MSKRSIGIVSGHWTVLLHAGHIQYIREAAQRCERLYAIINNSQQVAAKGLPELFDYEVMQDILRHLGCSQCFLSIDEDESIAKTIKQIYLEEKQRISYYHSNDSLEISLFNSGDRPASNWNQKEVEVCTKYNIAMVYLPLPKVDSSSKRLKKAAEHFCPDYGILQSKIKEVKKLLLRSLDYFTNRAFEMINYDNKDLYPNVQLAIDISKYLGLDIVPIIEVEIKKNKLEDVPAFFRKSIDIRNPVRNAIKELYVK